MKYRPFFEKFAIRLGWLIYHEYCNSVRKIISEHHIIMYYIFNLGIIGYHILKNEQKKEDMITILDELQRYVPDQTYCESVMLT